MDRFLPERQKWLELALQGLAFWIGHRHSLFKDYPLSEGALVSEACNLIQANLPYDLVLMPECMYKNLVTVDSTVEGVGPQARADLVLCDIAAKRIGREGNVSAHTKFVIEVKRGSASTQSINEDLSRLHAFLQVARQGTRCFLFIVSESYAPRRFVKDGRSILGAHPVPGTTGNFRVRRSVKAAASFSGKETAHYVCLLEVFLEGQKSMEI
ncbi:hypothetical protein [Burkholderia sp. Ac-20392]|uniref:hypothetical protein n=1 Tax=Burkholderia sp. Ac-20392 TaxID=2703905 RepID=UPI00197EA874|nr:hypothetical protein [Burkholderia sp. Ac-20392]MBN3797217.1 hypothetical protein [Burkholderia sp. Ac-20392]